MPGQSQFQVLRQADIEAFWHLNALQDVNVEKIHGWLAEPKPAGRSARNLPAFAKAPARQPSPSATLRAKAYNRFLEKARPEGDLRYLSKSAARF
jgi:hypothetical protein